MRPFQGNVALAQDFDSLSPSKYFVHLAALNRCDDEYKILDTNVLGTYNVARHCLKNRIKLLVAGSTKHYGMYAASKRVSETILTALLPCGLVGAYLRLPNVFGPHCRPYYNSFVSTILHHISIDEPYEHLIHDPFAEIRLLHVSDLCKAIDTLLTGCLHDFAERHGSESPFSIDFWNAGEFRITIGDFCRIAEGDEPINSPYACQRTKHLIQNTLDWYKNNAKSNKTHRR